MRFVVVAEDLGFNRLPRTIRQSPGSGQAKRLDGSPYQRNLFERTAEDELNTLEGKVATCLDQQERLFFWYRNRPRKDCFVQGWNRGRIYADFIATLRPDDEPDPGDAFHRVFVIETKGLHLTEAADTACKRSVFDICFGHATRADWAEFAPAMSRIGMRFEIVDEREWERRRNAMCVEQAPPRGFFPGFRGRRSAGSAGGVSEARLLRCGGPAPPAGEPTTEASDSLIADREDRF